MRRTHHCMIGGEWSSVERRRSRPSLWCFIGHVEDTNHSCIGFKITRAVEAPVIEEEQELVSDIEKDGQYCVRLMEDGHVGIYSHDTCNIPEQHRVNSSSIRSTTRLPIGFGVSSSNCSKLKQIGRKFVKVCFPRESLAGAMKGVITSRRY